MMPAAQPPDNDRDRTYRLADDSFQDTPATVRRPALSEALLHPIKFHSNKSVCVPVLISTTSLCPSS